MRAFGWRNQKHSECLLTRADARSTNSGGAGVGGGNSCNSAGAPIMIAIYKVRRVGASAGRASKQTGLIAGRGPETQFCITQFRRDAALRRSFQVAFHDQVRLINFFDRVRLFPDRHGERA